MGLLQQLLTGFASSGSDQEQQQGYPLLGVRAVLGEPNPPRSSDYYSILLLSSENLECVIDWGLRLTPSGRTVLGVHFNKGTPQQAADFSIRAIRRAQEVNPGVEFEITVRPSCASIIPIAAELSRHCRFLVIGDSGKTNTRHREMVSRCAGNVIIARSELALKASAVRDFVVGVGARDQEGALRALSMAFALARAAGDGRGANVSIIYIPVQPWQFGQQEDILSIGYKSSQLLQSVQDTVKRLEAQHPGVKVALKMGNPTDRMHVQDELLSTAERNGILLKPSSPPSSSSSSSGRYDRAPPRPPPILVVGGGHNSDCGELGSVTSQFVDKGRKRSLQGVTVAVAKLGLDAGGSVPTLLHPVVDLKERMKAIGLSSSGLRKHELIDRLLQHYEESTSGSASSGSSYPARREEGGAVEAAVGGDWDEEEMREAMR
ncbi:hypothetical protein FOZ62_031313, partial [Perkinsus olseni]